MDKQKAKIKKLFIELGYDTDGAEAMADAYLSEDGDADTTEIIQKAQEHFKPVMKTLLKKELSPEFKGQYLGEAIKKIAQASGGKIKASDFEGNIEGALEALAASFQVKAGDPDETTKKLNDALLRIAELEEEPAKVEAKVRGEYAEKENARNLYDTVLSKLGAKKLTVDQTHAAKAALRELGDDYVLKYDESAKAIGIYSKSNPGEIAIKDGKVLSIDSLLDESLTRNNWIAQSNGGAGGDKVRQIVNVPTFNRPDAGGGAKIGEPSSFRANFQAQAGTGTDG